MYIYCSLKYREEVRDEVRLLECLVVCIKVVGLFFSSV